MSMSLANVLASVSVLATSFSPLAAQQGAELDFNLLKQRVLEATLGGGDGGGANCTPAGQLPTLTVASSKILGDQLTLAIGNSSYLPFESVWLSLGAIGGGGIIVDTQVGGCFDLLPIGVNPPIVVFSDPSHLVTFPLPNDMGLVGLVIHSQALAFVIDGVNGKYKWSPRITFALDPQAPQNLTYTDGVGANKIYLVGDPITPNVPTVDWPVDTWTSVRDLPDGLLLNASTGEITGTPTTITPQGDYTIIATNVTGNTTIDLDLTIDPQVPTAFDYSDNPAVYTAGTPIPDNNPIITGVVESYSVNPNLPDGLFLDTGTGVISGTPDGMIASAFYTVTATNVTGFVTTDVEITVNPAAPTNLSYDLPLANYPDNVLITQNKPTVTAEVVDLYTVTPALPAGLSLSPVNGIITGTPTTSQGLASYLITASNVTGSTDTTIQIAIDTLVPPVLSLTAGGGPGENLEYLLSGTTTIKGIQETLRLDFDINPTGTYFNNFGILYLAQTQDLIELPGDGSHTWSFPVPNDVNQVGITYHAQATGFVLEFLTGATRISNLVSTTISLPAPTDLEYGVTELALLVDTPMTPITPTVSGFVDMWEVDPALPTGLNFNTNDGTISGTPTQPTGPIAYTITASNPSDGTTAELTIRILSGLYPHFGFIANVDDDTLTAVSIDDSTGQLRHLSYALTGDEPRGVAVTSDAQYVYVANEDGNNVTGYEFDTATGVLTVIGTTSVGLDPEALAISPDDGHLYVGCSGAVSNGVYAFTINGNGSLSAVTGSPFSGGSQPNALAIGGTNNNILLAASADGADELRSYVINANGSLSAVSNVATGSNPQAVSVSRDGGFAYVANRNSDDVSAYSITVGGTLSELGSSPYSVSGQGGDGPDGIAASPSTDYLYTANSNNGTVTAFEINGNGSLSGLGSVSSGSGTFDVNVDTSGSFLFALNAGDNEAAIFDIQPNGSLVPATPIDGVRMRDNPRAIVTTGGSDPLVYSSEYAYVGNEQAHDIGGGTLQHHVFQYTLDGSGNLAAQTPPSIQQPLGPGGVSVHPSQLYLHTSDFDQGTVAANGIGVDGLLTGIVPPTATDVGAWDLRWEGSGRFGYATAGTPAGGVRKLSINLGSGIVTADAPTATGGRPRSGAVDPSGRFYYVPNQDDDTISQFTINPVNGDLTAMTTATVAAGNNPLDLIVDPSGRYAYSISFLTSGVNQYTIDENTGALTANGLASFPQPGYQVKAMAIDPSGRLVFCAASGIDQIRVLSVDQSDGTLTELGLVQSAIDDPQGVVVDASGQFLLVTNAGGVNLIQSYTIDYDTGAISALPTVFAGGTPREVDVNRTISTD